eukprot:2094070-Amphidinium_carterae.3
MVNKTRIARSVSQAATECPEPVDNARFKEVLQCSAIPASVTSAKSNWYKQVCRMRKYFSHAVLGFVQNEGVLWVRVTLLRLSPFYIGMLLLKKITMPKLAMSETQCLDEAAFCTHVHVWRVTDCHSSQDFFDDPNLLDVVVCVQTTCVGNGLVASYHDIVPLEGVLHALEKDAVVVRHRHTDDEDSDASRSKPTRAKRTRHVMESAGSAAGPSTGAHVSDSDECDSASRASETLEEANPPDVESAWNKVHETVEIARRSWRETWGDSSSWFRTELSGGAWQVNRTGREIYGTRINLKPQSPAFRMAQRFNMPLSASFEINVYGNETGPLLAQVFAHVMSHYTVCWLDSGEPQEWESVLLTGLVVPEHLQLDEAISSQKARKRYRELIAIKPDTRKKRR